MKRLFENALWGLGPTWFLSTGGSNLPAMPA
jgi:hypothetical protein